jgi:hypothetical protein
MPLGQAGRDTSDFLDRKRCFATLIWRVDGQLAFVVAHIQGMSSSMRACGQLWTKRVSSSVR